MFKIKTLRKYRPVLWIVLLVSLSALTYFFEEWINPSIDSSEFLAFIALFAVILVAPEFSAAKVSRQLAQPEKISSELHAKLLLSIQISIDFWKGFPIAFGCIIAIPYVPPQILIFVVVLNLLLSALLIFLFLQLPVRTTPQTKPDPKSAPLLKDFILNHPESFQKAKSFLRKNQPTLAILSVKNALGHSYQNSRALLPRIAAQDLKQLFPE